MKLNLNQLIKMRDCELIYWYVLIINRVIFH